MQNHLTAVMFTGQRRMIETLGDGIWESLCDGLQSDRWSLDDAASVLQKSHGYSHRTAKNYAAAVIRNVIVESGADVVHKSGMLYAWS